MCNHKIPARTINKFPNPKSAFGPPVKPITENKIPEDHLGIWYGKTNEEGNPRYRTVPIEYCNKIKDAEGYH